MLGLIGGLGVGATVAYYRALVEAHKAVGRIPRLLIAHANLDHVFSLVRDGRSGDLARYLGDLADRLAFNEATAGFLAIDCTRLHVAGIMRRILGP